MFHLISIMKYRFVLLLACAVSLLAASRAQAQLTTFLNNGPSSNRVDIVFLGDGYTSSQLNTYQTHINSMMTHLFNQGEDPFPRYNKFFNAHRIDVISQQSGADDPNAGVAVNTALDSSYRFDGSTQRLLYVSNSKANAALNAGLNGAFTADMKIVTVNSTQYGGGGGTWAVYAGGNTSATEIALHELGHSFGGLADEYGGNTTPYTGSEPNRPNVTKDSTGAKWSQWIGYNQPGIGVIGAYQGGNLYDSGIYRPSSNSKMRNLNRPFDAVSREELILDIYRIVNPLDAWLSNSGTLTNPTRLWVDPIDSDVIDQQWLVNGQPITGQTGEELNPLALGLGPGTYTFTAHTYDPTDWVRTRLDLLTQDISWTVAITVPEPSFYVMAGMVVGVLGIAAKRRRTR